MKFRNFTVLSLVGFALVALGGIAKATPAGLTGPIDTYSSPFGAAHITTVISDLDTYLGVSSVCFVGRLDSSSTDLSNATCSGLSTTPVSGTGLTTTSGTWTFDPGSTSYKIVGLEINGGSNGDLYAVTPPALSGSWNTFDLLAGNSNNHPSLSHLDFYAEIFTSRPVPEPTTLALMGIGLVGFGLVRRRRAL